MDNLVGTNIHSSSSSLRDRKAPKKSKTNKNKPMKVVYISNPMKFKTCASKFRALVQEFTGQDAKFPDPSRFLDNDSDVGDGGNNQTVEHEGSETVDDHKVPIVDLDAEQAITPDHATPLPLESSFDDIFMAQMFENLSGLMPSSLLYESSANVN